MFRLHSILFFSFFASSQVQVTEIDNLTYRNTPLRDVSGKVNTIVNGYLKEVAQQANRTGNCNERRLRYLLAKRIGTGFVSEIEKEIESDKTIDQVFTKRKNSIYRDFKIYEAPGIFAINFGSLLNVNGFIVGTDKIGHFLGTGFSYYKRVHYRGKTVGQALAFGEKTERTYYGMMLNGVYSYGDLAANYDGFKFWERVIGSAEKDAAEPYLRCQDNRWVQNDTFDIADYINSAWDEGINCNRYRSKKMLRKVTRRMTLLENTNHATYVCPIAPQECDSLIERYGEAANSVITPACFNRN